MFTIEINLLSYLLGGGGVGFIKIQVKLAVSKTAVQSMGIYRYTVYYSLIEMLQALAAEVCRLKCED